jgi:hypothetical protein
MNIMPKLTGSHRRTYKTIFQHPISHNLEWRAVYGLLEKLGDLVDEPNGNMKATRNGQTLVLTQPATKDVASEEEVMTLRHFIEQSEPAATTQAEVEEKETHFLLIIDHRQARIFRSKMQGAVPEQILPHEPDDFFRQAPDSKDFARGQEKPDPNSFFEPVAKALQNAGQILVFGTGVATGSEMDQFVAWLKIHHPPIAARIIGSITIDEQHLTDDQLLAKAREFYSHSSVSLA